ncbi:MAG TPA: ATPase, T2SS/T4P/T4SS family [Burkholderiales bacterium]|jgi:type II secretory ATPase GspE/PulE/Tfp pilus assembly ATPase PilB-like protein|nr:ATPase, T2SS/T4P/T4SS family [Burkholderiales bacterium]
MAKPSRSQSTRPVRSADARLEEASKLQWPQPPYYETIDEGELPHEEPASAQLRDGRKIKGALTRFDPTIGVFEMRPEGGELMEVAPHDLLDLRLTRPVTLKRRRSVIDDANDPDTPPERQLFRVTLSNDQIVEGETLGFDTHTLGLFLYVDGNGEGVTRVFIPSDAIKRKQIGRRLGDMLLSEQAVTPVQISRAIERQSAVRSRKLGDYLTREQIISRSDLAAAIERQRQMPVMRLGEALVAMALISENQLDDALSRQKVQRGKPLGEILVDLGLITREDLKRTLTQQLGIPFVDLTRYEVEPAVLKLVPAAVAAEYNVMPLCIDGRALVLAVENPLDPIPLDRIRFLSGMPIAPVMAAANELRDAVKLHYGLNAPTVKIEDLAAELDNAVTSQEIDEDQVRETDSVLVRLVNKMVIDASEAKASDIHIESYPGRQPVRVRFRQDGILREYLTLPASYRAALISRVKIMASLDISEKRRAQDGKILFQNFGPAKLELRLATIPTNDGLEDAVLRVLPGGGATPMDQLGLRPPVLASLEKVAERPYGILLVCGPTGSGKTTTLHSVLSHINTPDLKIWTAEDPVEILQPGLRQVQVHAKIGWTFAAAMRSFLRADPDVIMIGEMRDEETARIAIEASLTGHLVLSTLHTNSAPESVVRLLDMGMQPFNFADSMLGILAQRLVRRLCVKCKVLEPLHKQGLQELAAEYCTDTALSPDMVAAEWLQRHSGAPKLPRAPGCLACGNSGYSGRLGIHELLVNSPLIRPLIRRSAGADELRTAGIAEGMRTLRQDGIEKCLDGLTDIHEVRGACA